MSDKKRASAKLVRTVFLVPPDFSGDAQPLLTLAEQTPDELKAIATSFAASLKGVVLTLSIPFQYTFSRAQSLHWQRFHIAERIRARGNEDESAQEQMALANARTKFHQYLEGEGKEQVIDDVLEDLERLMSAEESLAAAHELTRQGIVLIWSAIEVLARDTFVYLLNRKPHLSDQLLTDPGNRKRFSSERIDWQTLASYGYDLSRNLGDYLISKSDLKNVPAIRDAYASLFPAALSLHKALADRLLWNLSHKRHLIVHKRGIADQAYLDATGDSVAVGDVLLITPSEIEDALNSALRLGVELINEALKAG